MFQIMPDFSSYKCITQFHTSLVWQLNSIYSNVDEDLSFDRGA